jgi:predicted nucleic acid-binding protein
VANPATFELRRVFVDTSAFFVLTSPRDTSYRRARAIQTLLMTAGSLLFTTNFILAEMHALILARIDRETAFRVLTEIDRSTVTVVRVSAADEANARDILRRYRDKDFR